MRFLSRPWFFCALALIAVAGWFAVPYWSVYQMKRMMAAQGFQVSSIGKTRIGLSGAEFLDIKLDPDGFSTIGSLRIPISPLPPYAVVLKDVLLTGDLGPEGLTVDGWNGQPLRFPGWVKTLILEYGRIDLMTDAGSIRIESRMQMVESTAGRHIDAAVYGNQNQLTFDTRWSTDWKRDGSWLAKGEIGAFRVRTDALDIARSSGTLDIVSGSPRTDNRPTFKGKLTAGLVSSGPASLREGTLTLDGPVDSYLIALRGRATHTPDIALSLKAQRRDGRFLVNASSRAPTLDALRAYLNETRPAAAVFKNIALSDKDIETVRKATHGKNYNSFIFSLKGEMASPSRVLTASNKKDKKAITLSGSPALKEKKNGS